MGIELSQSIDTYLIIAAILFTLGLVTVFTRRNLIGILMGVELMLNAAGINFLAFAFFKAPEKLISGHIFSIFIIVLAAAEAVVALAIILAMFQQRRTLDVNELNELRG